MTIYIDFSKVAFSGETVDNMIDTDREYIDKQTYSAMHSCRTDLRVASPSDELLPQRDTTDSCRSLCSQTINSTIACLPSSKYSIRVS